MPTTNSHPPTRSLWPEIGVVLLSLLSVGLLVYEVSVELSTSQVAFIHTIDILIAVVFLSDFILGMYKAPHKWAYLGNHWLDLLASIPITEGVFRALRGLRLLRIVRVIRVATRIQKIANISEAVITASARYIYISIVTSIVLLSGALVFFTAEVEKNTGVNSFFDALWWAVVTTTTVGYGDVFPVTWTGRVVGMILMFFGVGLVGAIAGVVGHFLFEQKTQKPSK